MNLTQRRAIIVLTAFILLGGLTGYQILKNQKKEPPRKPVTEAIRPTVQTGIINPESLPVSIPLQGRITAFEKADLYAEVNGIFLGGDYPLKVGVKFTKGNTIVRLDDKEARMNLHGQRAAFMASLAQILPDIKIDFNDRYEVWKNYLDKLDPEKTLPDLPATSTDREKYFMAARSIPTQYYTIRSAEERLTKYRIVAPFDGTITNALVSPGTLVRPGQMLGQFQRSGSFELATTLSLSDIAYLKIGQKVKLTSDDTGQQVNGTIVRIGEILDPATQMVPVYISVQNAGLKEGMYFYGSIEGSVVKDVFPLPKSLLVNGSTIWVVRDSQLVLQPVELLRSDRKHALITGFKPGEPYLTKINPGIYEGMNVNWTIQ